MTCGRVRKPIGSGWNPIVHDQLQRLNFDALSLLAGDEHSFSTSDREYAIVLIEGECEATLSDGSTIRLGPRANPFEHEPFAIFVSREEHVSIQTTAASFLGIGSAPAEKKRPYSLITPDQVDTGWRGADNWSRLVRKVCWSDNTEGNLLLAGETVVPSGNWATMPPHRHQRLIPGEEVPYEEIYFFRFSQPNGFGLLWQFDDEMDQAFSLKMNDAITIDAGYHPVVCGPGSTLYQLTLMAGPYRVSKASVHPDYQALLEAKNLDNQYRP